MNIIHKKHCIVAHFKTGKLLKGYTDDFVPTRETFRLRSAYRGGKENTYEVRTNDLKALFFVKTLEGKKDYVERKHFGDVDARNLRGVKIEAEFIDGEIIRGTSFDYGKNFKGFYIVPVDPQSNNEKVYVITDSTRHIAIVQAADV
jgi:hypothetical protein